LYFNGIDADSGETTASAAGDPSLRHRVRELLHADGMGSRSISISPIPGPISISPTTAAEDVTPGGTLVDEAIHLSLSGGAPSVARRAGRRACGCAISVRARWFPTAA
jgi:hypothetical protein